MDICDTCAFEDACPSSHFHPTGRNVCAAYKTILLEPAPCPICGMKFKFKVTVCGEVVFDHPRHESCAYRGKRLRTYTVAEWNRKAGGYNEIMA